VLFSARAPAHPRALLIGLDFGPNLAVTGSLSALLWFQSAKGVGARPSLVTVTKIGLVLVPCSILAALAASATFSSGRL
jgi:arsenical pump membrane protein